jgi:hypothetical protein
LEVHKAQLPVREGTSRKVIVIKEHCLEESPGRISGLSDVHDGLIWISQQPVEPDVARRAAQLLALVDQMEAKQRDPSLEIGTISVPWSEMTIPDSGELKEKPGSEEERRDESPEGEMKLREAWIEREEGSEDEEDE